MVMLVAKEGDNLFAMCLMYKGTTFVPFECVNFGKLQVFKKKKKPQPKGIPVLAVQLPAEGIPSLHCLDVVV